LIIPLEEALAPIPTPWLPFFIVLFGLCIGSFLNVVIHRLPLGQPLGRPARSRCPHCQTPIAVYDNIPLLSYVLLQARCRHCKGLISPRYPLVELMGGLFALAVYRRFGWHAEAIFYYAFIAALIAVTFIDLDHQIIPDAISLPGIPVFALAALVERQPIWFFNPLPLKWQAAVSAWPVPPMVFGAVLGIIAGGGSLFLVAWVYQNLTGKEGMGGGDIKLLAMIGALLGWEGVVFTIFTGSAVGTLAGAALMAGQRLVDFKLKIPFGPFLAIGAIAYIFVGQKMIGAYLGLIH
jgi:leader peptidase (prepilin peptidase)/N-methyltransferase